MKKQIELIIFPENIYNQEFIHSFAAKKLNVNPSDITGIRTIRRSIDARQRPIFKLLVDVFINEPVSEDNPKYVYPPVDGKKKVIVVEKSSKSAQRVALAALQKQMSYLKLKQGCHL